jgi:Uma2 family endonuclease
LLLIEIADASLVSDREVKLPLYACSGIAEVWLVDLNEGAIERHTEPFEAGYRLVRSAMPGETLESAALPGLATPVATVLT